MSINFSAVDEPVEKQLTWSKGLGVPNTNKTIVVHFSLKGGGGEKKKVFKSQCKTITFPFPRYSETLCSTTYTDGGIVVQLVFGCNTKACAVAASSPCQVDCSLQIVAHLLVDGATKLSTVIASKIITQILGNKNPNMGFLKKVSIDYNSYASNFSELGSGFGTILKLFIINLGKTF